MSLLLPAIQKTREAANKMRCASNLKQLGVACHNFENAHERLPPGARIRNNDWGAYSTGGFAQNQGTWLLCTLPYVEQRILYDFYQPQIQEDDPSIGYYPAGQTRPEPRYSIQFLPDWKKPTPGVMRCPSDDIDHTDWPAGNYSASMGPTCCLGPCGNDPYQRLCNQPHIGIPASPPYFGEYGNWCVPTEGLSPANIRGLFGRCGPRITQAMIIDGTSNTIMAGESLPMQDNYKALRTSAGLGTGHWAGAATGGYSQTLSPINYRTDQQVPCGNDPLRSWENWNLSWGFKSRHPKGANFLFADGSVRFLSEDIEHEQTYQLLGCRNDEKVIEY